MKDYKLEIWFKTQEYRCAYVVKSPNGREIAECYSERMAKKIIKGLKLQDLHHAKTKQSIGS